MELVQNCNTLGKEGSVADLIIKSESSHDWLLHLSRDTRPILELLNLLQVIGITPPNLHAGDDTLSWAYPKDGGHTVKTSYDHFLDNGVLDEQFPTRMIWSPRIPPKICFFIWTVYHIKILTLNNLQKRGHQLANACYFCLGSAECTNHLLLHFPFAREIWARILPQIR
ncbi:Reverse transcriptase zinc-binding domain [Macleaya cordata]|uniref:Reverse transcriptase zinc-binding domain n=1 Tax=Macleaya cordata TaxID=56857 RepID=A0A200R059_MACCD|nr:Reverse transcriptase zinc-binding domain [Macleaya cordata]